MVSEVRAGARPRPLVGRDEELATIEGALAATRSGSGGLLLVEGPAGIGKTSVLGEARRGAAAAGMTVVQGVGTDFERDYPFGVVQQALGPLVRSRADRERLLTGTARLAEPALLEVGEGLDASPFGLLNGLYWLLASLADERPLLLTVDDAHWADEPSLRFLGFLARRIDSVRIAVIVGARTEADFGAAPAGLAEVRDHARAHGRRLEPAALDARGAAELLAAVAHRPVDPALAGACRQATGGNPFLLDELGRALRDHGAAFTEADADRVAALSVPGVTRSVAATLDRLGAREKGLARAVAVLGEGAAPDLVGELAGIDPEIASAAAGELIRAGLLEDATDLRFRHPIFAGAVRDGMAAHERATAHARAAEMLRARGAPAERVALQLLHVRPARDERAVAELRHAARRARERGAPATAARLLERALAEPPTPGELPDVLIELGRAEADRGRAKAAAERFAEAHRSALDPLARGRAAAMLATVLPWEPATMRRVNEVVQATHAEVAPLDRELGLRLRAFLVLEERAVDDLALAGDTVAEAACLGALVFARTDATARADDIADLALRGARQAHALLEEGAIGLSFTGIVLGLRWTDRLGDAERLLARAIEVARRRGSTADFAMAMTLRANVHRRAGRLREAEADARSALPADLDDRWLFARGIQPLVCSLLDQGRVDDAAAELAAVVPRGEELPDAPPMIPVVLARMALHAAAREHELALSDWHDALRRAGQLRGVDRAVTPGWIEDLAVAAGVHHALGDEREARATADRALAMAERWGTPGAIGQALHAQVRVGAAGDPEAAMTRAVSLLAESPARLEHARALVGLGALLRRRGRRVDSRDPLREGHELATRCGATTLAETARAERRASGVRARRPTPRGADALTASERRIAEMAAAGMTNAEIAQELFLTVKTVEMHLTQSYRKLGVPGRRELARALAAPA